MVYQEVREKELVVSSESLVGSQSSVVSSLEHPERGTAVHGVPGNLGEIQVIQGKIVETKGKCGTLGNLGGNKGHKDRFLLFINELLLKKSLYLFLVYQKARKAMTFSPFHLSGHEI